MRSKTRLKHTCPTEAPFDCTKGDMTGEGFLVVVDKRTHELVIPRERETEEAVTVIVRPRGGPPLVEEREQPGVLVTAGADVTKDGVTGEVFPRLLLTLEGFRRLRWE